MVTSSYTTIVLTAAEGCYLTQAYCDDIRAAIITERVYAVPGIGNLLTTAINTHDNGVIVACTVFYTSLSILSLILGDLLLAKYDPRISLSKEGGGGR